MRVLTQISASRAKGATTRPSSGKVCMHVLGTARTDRRVMREATALVEAGFEVSIVDIEGQRHQPVEEEIQGVCVKHILMSDSFMATRFTRWALFRAAQLLLLGSLRLIQTPADIYHAHDVAGLPACYIAALLRRRLLIFDAHERPLDEPSNELFHRMESLLAYLLARLVSRCAGIITVSPPILEELSNRYHVPMVSLVRNVLPFRAVPKSDRLRQLLGLGPAVRIALYQGHLQPLDRGLETLIRSAAFLEPNIVIVMMGKGYGTIQSEYEALIASEGVADRVKIIPPVPYEELLEWTASADLGLIVYPHEFSLNVRLCLPNKLFEYLMAGLPVLASQLDAVAEVIKTYDAGQIVSSLAPIDIGAVINTMLTNPAALAKMRQNALEAARRDLCWEKESQHLVHFYLEILAAQAAEKTAQSSSGLSHADGEHDRYPMNNEL
jgi:glycosyltransferase involved in cell wall biosynthesis